MSSLIVTKKTIKPVLYSLLILFILTGFVYSQDTNIDKNVVPGESGMVATAHPLASQAGIDMLKMGGNAVDAAVASAFAIGVVEPDGSGLGGGGGMVIYMSDTKQAHYINYYHQAASKVDGGYNNSLRHSTRAVLVPGTVAGLIMALEEFGTLPLATVLEPAIRYADEGFEIDGTLAQILLDNIEIAQSNEATAQIYLDDGFPKMEGDILVQSDLAETLKEISRLGNDGFYSGKVAEKIVGDIQAGGGVITLDDFKNYKARLIKPLIGSYRGYKILSANAPQSGTAIIQALNMIENADIAKMGNYADNASTLHIMAETFKRVYADRWSYLGDPEQNYIPVSGMISKAYARERYMDINPFVAEPKRYRDMKAGKPSKYDSGTHDSSDLGQKANKSELKWDDDDSDGQSTYNSWGEELFDSWGSAKKTTSKSQTNRLEKDTAAIDPWLLEEEEFDGHTTHMSIIDKDGNAVSLTQTLGTFFGCGVSSAGVLLNCGMANYSNTSKPNIITPNMQPRSSISPTIVLKDDKPEIILGSPGASRIICTVVELIVNIVDFKMDAYEANIAPRFYCQKFEDYLHLEYGISDKVQKKLSKIGHTIRLYEGLDLFFGGAQLILVDPVTGTYYGSADTRRGGAAIGY